VLLNIRDTASLSVALETLRGNLAERAPGVLAELALIQPMRPGMAEVLVGYRIDPDAGPLIMLAAGGIWTDLLRDRSIRLAPVSVATAEEMISEVRALKILTGLRGKPRGDLTALAEAISALSQLAIQPEHGVLEAEVNPLMIMGEGQGVLAVDALILQR
jgi:succinyl-CoA synthetase beta subunit